MPPSAPSPPTPSETAASASRPRPATPAPPPTLRVEDLLHAFLASSTRDASPAMRVARALRQFFVAPRVRVAVGRFGASPIVHSSAACDTLRQEPVVWDLHEAKALLGSMASRAWPRRPVQVAPVEWSIGLCEQTRSISVGLAWADPNDGFVVWSRLEGLSDLARAREQADALDRDLSNMRLFASAIRSVQLFERAESEQQRVARVRGDVDELLLAADPGRQTELRSVIELLRDLNAPDASAVPSVLHEPLRRIASLALNRALQALEPLPLEEARELSSHLRALASSLPCESAQELRCIAICILPSDDPAGPCTGDDSTRSNAVRLLAHASRALSLALEARTAGDERACAEQKLPALCQLIRAALPALLCEIATLGEMRSPELLLRPIESVRIWLRLWLVLEVASIHRPQPTATSLRALTPELFELFRALAGVLREGLREYLYSGTPGFHLHERMVEAGLRVLVPHHAHWKCGVPRELDLPGHLEDVASNRQGQLEAEGQLDHVIDVYISSYFLANLRIGPCGAASSQRAALHIVGQTELGPSPKASADFQIALALAALFHDSGMMLFPNLPSGNRVLDAADDVAEALHCIRVTVCDAARNLIETCVKELELHECIDLAQEPELETWVEGQRARGEPNHALLSAWYLLKVCTRGACLRPEVIRATVRATLLHGALGVAIDPAENGVAALLVLCDEICDWPPARASSPLARDTRSLNDRIASPDHYKARTRSLGIEGLWLARDAHGALCIGLDPARAGDGASPSWPRITLGLRKPHELAGAVLELWLRSAQNIGRIRRSGAGWAPTITLEGDVPARLLAVGQTTRSLLDATAQRTRSPIRGRLHHWLENSAVFPDCERAGAGQEAVQLIGLQRPLASDDIALYLPELLETAFLILEDRERGLRR